MHTDCQRQHSKIKRTLLLSTDDLLPSSIFFLTSSTTEGTSDTRFSNSSRKSSQYRIAFRSPSSKQLDIRFFKANKGAFSWRTNGGSASVFPVRGLSELSASSADIVLPKNEWQRCLQLRGLMQLDFSSIYSIPRASHGNDPENQLKPGEREVFVLDILLYEQSPKYDIISDFYQTLPISICNYNCLNAVMILMFDRSAAFVNSCVL
ncbi:LOW QUALITY PROTEIN: hypothetical protein M514_09750 [Trichuris suis]|uniref:Uncharacterized protein n=1 Tax=Trichuris suis TaxID=68888 RepID=A0A085LWP1_9BILA|nr:LOW QUALITY PROTEIN: hypothetical protein M513_09750 [Trichuris suis]KFD64547.1 LOW QUALITY PROTEIN: hypothetical protein M514_09750 [Trichuris suis]